jgi:hypothetical protein
MSCQIKNPSNIDLTSLEPHVQGMYDYFDKKLGFNKPPTMVFDSDPGNQSNVLGKTAYYDPSSLEIHVFTDGRHPKDMLRSIAHELIHHLQNQEGRLEVGGYMGEGYYLKNEEMKKLENEAMLKGNSIMREYEDNLKLEEKDKMSLKEWKNNELNQQLLKKFGILKEEKKPDYLDLDKDGDKEEPMSKAANDAKKGNSEEESQEELNETEDYSHFYQAQADEKKAKDKKEKKGDESKKKDEEIEEGRNNPRTTNADKFVGHEDRYQADRIHESKSKKLQESIKRIAKASKVVLKSQNKRIK